MPFRLLASADLHLGRSSSELPEDSELASTRTGWERMVSLAVREQVDALLLAGDIVDRNNRYFEAFGPLHQGFRRLHEAGIPVIMVAGNHDFDVLPQLIGHQEHPNVQLLGKDGHWEHTSLQKDGHSLQILGWSFPSEHHRKDPSSNISREGLDPNNPCIGLLHGDSFDAESPYAPIDTGNLKSGPAQAWILGHIHKPEAIHDSDPLIQYPGSPQALSPKETGEHGVLMINVQDDRRVELERIPLSPVRYEQLEVDLSESAEEEKVRQTLTAAVIEDAEAKAQDPGAPDQLIHDLILTGEHPRPENAEQWAEGMSRDFQHEVQGVKVKVRKVRSRLRPAIGDLEEWAKESSPAGKLAALVLKLQRGESDPFIEEMLRQWKEKQQRSLRHSTYLPLAEKERIEEATDEETRAYLLQEAEELLREFQVQKEGPAS